MNASGGGIHNDTAGRHSDTIGVLFVCHANICRSPLAHGVFASLIRERGLEGRFDVDSAGTWAAQGDPPHAGSVTAAGAQGVDLAVAGLSRGLEPGDLQRFTHLIVMDRANLADVERLRRLSAFGAVQGGQARVRLLREVGAAQLRGQALDVADPVHRGPEAFAEMYRVVAYGCRALLDELS